MNYMGDEMRKFLKTIGIWGDSLLQGVILDEAQNKYSILPENCAAAVSRKTGLKVSNNSRFGCTAPKGLRALSHALESDAEFSVAIIEFGGNDCDFDWARVAAAPEEEHLPRTPLDAFVKCYSDMITALKGKGIEPVLVTLPPLDAERYFNWITKGGLSRENILRWLGDVQHIYRWHERYSNAVQALARRFACRLVDVRDAFLSKRDYNKYLCADGIHPNRAGHALMESVFCEYAAEFVR
jgi:acyl-CoA thioesterase-1